VPGGNLDLLRARFGPGDDVGFLDMTVLGHNPSNIIPAIPRFTDAHPGARTRFVASVATTIVCPYRADQLDQSVLDDAEVTHPHLMDTGHAGDSPRYSGAAVARAIAEQRLAAAPADADEFTFGAGDLPRLRRRGHPRAPPRYPAAGSAGPAPGPVTAAWRG
jgi:hypothetical protein